MTSWLRNISPQVHDVRFSEYDAHHFDAEATAINHHRLVFFLRGMSIVRVDGLRLEAPPGSYVIIPAGMQSRLLVEGRPVRTFSVDFEWVARGDAPRGDHDLAETPEFVPKGVLRGAIRDLPRLTKLLDAVAFNWPADSEVEYLTCRSSFLELLCRLLLEDEALEDLPQRGTELAHSAKCALDDALSTPISVRDLLEELGYSYEHVCRTFKKHFGISPLRYVNGVRIERAKRMLLEPTNTVADVARAVGVMDPAYFSRMFRAHVGVSPSEYSGRQGNSAPKASDEMEAATAETMSSAPPAPPTQRNTPLIPPPSESGVDRSFYAA